MRDDKVLVPEIATHLQNVYGCSDPTTDNLARKAFTTLYDSHEALRAERDLFRGLAMRHIDGWHPQFHVDPAKCVWVSNWPENPDELMTAAEVEWYRKRREART